MADLPRRPGRPGLDAGSPSVSVSLKLPSKDYDDACRVAQARHESVAAVIRRGLHRLIRDERGG